MIGSLLTNHGFYFCRDAANACRRPSGIYNSLVIPSGFHNLGISNQTSFSYPQTFLSVGISNKTSFSYPQTFLSVGIISKTSFPYPQTFHSVGISNQTSFSYPQTFHSVGISNQTSFSYPQTFHSVGISNKTSLPYPQAFHSVGISSKTSFPYPQTFIVWVSATKQASHTHKLFTLRQKKGTEKLDPISCAHTEAKEWVQAELVRSTAILRYEPCPQFINVSQRALHIYWQFSAMSHAIHKIVSKRRCQSYFISRRSPHHGIVKDSDLCASAHRCL